MRRMGWNSRRMTVQGIGFALLLFIPLLNFYLDWNFLQGWYQSIGIGDLWIVSPLEGLESILVSRDIYGPLAVALLLPVLIALAMGRIFCGWLCPIHFLSDCGERLQRLVWRKKRIKERWPAFRQLLFLALALELVVTVILGAPLFVMLSPPGLVGREMMLLVFFHTLAIEGVIVVAVLTVNLISRRYFCRYLCPLGGLLALLGARRSLRVVNSLEACAGCGRCRRSCPLGLYAGKGEGQTVYCWNCGSCIDACQNGQLSFSWIKHPFSSRSQISSSLQSGSED